MIETIWSFFRKVQPKFLALSVALSVGLWFTTLNFIDPVTHESFSLPLLLVNESTLTENRRLIEHQNRQMLDNIMVTVHLTGQLSVLNDLMQNHNIFAYIDLDSSELVHVPSTRLRENIPVRVNIGFAEGVQDSGLTVTSMFPQMVDVVMDQIAQRIIVLTVEFEGEPPPGYVALAAEREPTNVQVIGPSFDVQRISRIGARVDVSDAREDIVGEYEIVAFNVFGEIVPLQDIELSEEIISFRVPVYKTATVEIKLGEEAYIGAPVADIAVVDIILETETIEIRGSGNEVELVREIILSPIDITDIEGTAYFNVDLRGYIERINQERGLNTALLNPEAGTINVIFVTEQIIERDFTISVETVNFTGEVAQGNRLRQNLTESFTVTLRGVESVIWGIDKEDIICTVNMALLAEAADGEHTLDVVITSPEGTEVTGVAPTIRVSITTVDPENS